MSFEHSGPAVLLIVLDSVAQFKEYFLMKISALTTSLYRLVSGLSLIGVLLFASQAHAALDHQYSAFDALLSKHVKWNASGTASAVDYAGLKKERASLGKVLTAFSAVTQAEFDQFSREQQLAFLINAYNGFTLELILSKYPDLDSIKDLGGLFSGSPWSQDFFSLLGQKRTLDWIEHDQIRGSGRYNEPRIHFVVNCASIGCPALRPQAITADSLEASLEDSTKRFFSDRTRNYYDPQEAELQVTKLLDWYEDDFTKGHQGIQTVKGFLARYANQLSDDEAVRKQIGSETVDYGFTSYDWSLNKQ